MKLSSKDYPFIILVEDKISQSSGKLYQAISLGYTSVKNREALDPKEKYKTDFINFFDEKELLKLAELCNNTYTKIRNARELAKKEEKDEEQKAINKEYDGIKDIPDDDVPF